MIMSIFSAFSIHLSLCDEHLFVSEQGVVDGTRAESCFDLHFTVHRGFSLTVISSVVQY